MRQILMLLLLSLLGSCQQKTDPTKELWIYTSMYKDLIAVLTPEMEKAFPGVEFHWYQAGSEEIGARANGEIMAGGLRADLLISSDRFWYEELARAGLLVQYAPAGSERVPGGLKHPQHFYTGVSIPVMVLTYNREAIKDPPLSFLEVSAPKWNGKFTTGSPLASGTNFTTMAMLQARYGWEYFEKLKANGTISQGGNSAVIRRVQTLERPVGWVLLEDLLRLIGKDDRLGIIYPSDGVVTHANIMGIAKRGDLDRTLAKRVADWMLSPKAQELITQKGYMYSTIPGFMEPPGARPLSELMKNAFPWDQAFIDKTTENRLEIKDRFMEIMFQ